MLMFTKAKLPEMHSGKYWSRGYFPPSAAIMLL